MSNLQELSEEQLHEGIAAATRQIGAYNNELLRRKRSSESASSSSAAPSPKTPRTEESDDSDTEPEDYHVLKSTPIYVRRTEECGQNCELCPHVFQGESLPNMLNSDRPLNFKGGQPFNCNYPRKGIYAIICINPACPMQYKGPIYIGESGAGNGFLFSRIMSHKGQIESDNPEQRVHQHFTGHCKPFMRFLYLKEIKDTDKRKKKEPRYMQRFGTTILANGTNVRKVNPQKD